MAKRKLTDEELMNLRGTVDDGVYYLFLRDSDASERIFRMRNPSHDQGMTASMYMQSFLWDLRRRPDLKNREEVEEEFKDELANLRSELRRLEKQGNRLNRELIDNLPLAPDKETHPDEFNAWLEQQQKAIDKVDGEAARINARLGSIYAFSIEWLLQQRRAAVLAALCWEQNVDDNKWEQVWESWDEFKAERTALASRLETEAQRFLFAVPGFFDNSLSLPSGGSDI